MASGSLFQLLDEAIGTPEVNVNLEALRRLLRVILEHLSLLGLQDVIPQEGAQEAAPAPGQSHPAEAWAWDTGQPSQPPGEDELEGTRSGSPVTSGAADMGQMEKTDAKESDISKESHKEMAGIKAMQINMGKEMQRIKEALGQTTDLCKDLCKEINEMKATQSRMGEGIRMIQEALGQGNLQDAAGQPLVLQGQPASAKPYTSDMDKLGQSPAGLPTMESILRDLSELQGQMSSLQNLVRDLQGEKEKIRQLQDALGKLAVTAAECDVDGTKEIPLQLEPALREIKQEQKELRQEQNITKAILQQVVTDDQLQDQLNELRAMMGTGKQQQGESHTDNKLVRKLLHRCERLQQQVDSLVPQQVQRSLPEKTQEEELLKSIQATVVRVEGDCEQLGYVTGSLRDDHRQHQRDIEALFRSLEGLEKKADKEDLLLLLDRLELGPFQKQLEDNWAKKIKDLKDELTVEIDDAAGIKKQLLVPFKCLSCDRQLNMQVPGPHIDTLPLIPSLPCSHAAHPSTSATEEQAQQHSHRKLVNSKFLKSQSCKGQDTSSAPLKDVLHLSKKPSVTELLSTDDCVDEVEKRAQDKLGPTTLEEDQPASDVKL
ncbi:glutamine-rich protein 2-like isoform X3 [Agelaius phoeniceus]|uniref:glutamine-rich protein 2-like isoform X3 n=1 Tax=Agelaius phoeniceus TaxID=39638 RepID=UPI0040550381